MTWIELIAAFLGIVSVGLTIRQNILCWPTGLVMVTLYIFIFYDARLYSDAILQIVYVFLQIYGWWYWTRGGDPDRPAPPITTLSPAARLGWLGGVALGSLGVGAFMAFHTDAALPWPDAFILAASLAAQWLMGRKKLECWVLWIAVDVVGIFVYLLKDLQPTALLYVLFLAMATAGLFGWLKAMSAQAEAEA